MTHPGALRGAVVYSLTTEHMTMFYTFQTSAGPVTVHVARFHRDAEQVTLRTCRDGSVAADTRANAYATLSVSREFVPL